LGTIITISALALGIAFGVSFLIRLRAEPVEDPDDEIRRRQIEESLGLRNPARESGPLPPIVRDSAPQGLLPQSMDKLRSYTLH
jgi:hypothetical protein